MDWPREYGYEGTFSECEQPESECGTLHQAQARMGVNKEDTTTYPDS